MIDVRFACSMYELTGFTGSPAVCRYGTSAVLRGCRSVAEGCREPQGLMHKTQQASQRLPNGITSPVITCRRVMKVSAQCGAFSSSMSLMSLYCEFHASSADRMASIFSTATSRWHRKKKDPNKFLPSKQKIGHVECIVTHMMGWIEVHSYWLRYSW